MEEYKLLLTKELRRRYLLPNNIVFTRMNWEKLNYQSNRRTNNADVLDILYFNFIVFNFELWNLPKNSTFDTLKTLVNSRYSNVSYNKSILNVLFRIILIQARLTKDKRNEIIKLDDDLFSMFANLHKYDQVNFMKYLNIVSEIYFFMAQHFQVDYFSNLKLYHLIHPELRKFN